jgi:predicted nucleic-acid-binding protein
MRAVDTNVIIRLLVQDDEVQASIANKLFSTAEENKKPLFVSLLVVLEMLWVLQSVYTVERRDIIQAVSTLLQMPALKFEKQETIRQFLVMSELFTGDLSGILIAQSAVSSTCETTLTFDKKAAKFELFTLLEK